MWLHDSRVLLLLLLYVLYQAAAGHSLQSAWLVLTCLWPHFPGRAAWVTGGKPHCCWAVIIFLIHKKQQQNNLSRNIEPQAATLQCSSAQLSAIEVTRRSTFLVRLDFRGALRRGHPSAAFTDCCFDGLASDREAAVFLLFVEPLKAQSWSPPSFPAVEEVVFNNRTNQLTSLDGIPDCLEIPF